MVRKVYFNAVPRVQLGYVDNEGIGHDVPRVAQCQWVYGVKYVQRGPALKVKSV